MNKTMIGFCLLQIVVANSVTWLFGDELDTKTKLTIPNIIVLAIIIMIISLNLMGVE